VRRPAPRRGPGPCPARPRARHVPALVCLFTALCLFVLPACRDSQEPQPEFTPRGLFDIPEKKKALPVVLVAGDSLSISLADKLETAVGRQDCTLVRLGKVGGGITWPELLDYPAELAGVLRRSPPDVAVFMIGANDSRPVVTRDGARVLFDSPAWKAAYAAEATRLMDMVLAKNPSAAIFWVGAPPMADRNLSASLRTVNAALREACKAKPSCRFIDTWEDFSDAEDAYTPTALDLAGAQIPLRTADGVHLTDVGARRLAARVVSATAGALPVPPSPARETLFSALTDLTPIPQATASPPPREEGPRRHVVARGETLAAIARRHGLDAEALRRANKGLDPKKLRPGQTLILPSGDDGP
jgi:lysophospholipase L1-like esterase